MKKSKIKKVFSGILFGVVIASITAVIISFSSDGQYVSDLSRWDYGSCGAGKI